MQENLNIQKVVLIIVLALVLRIGYVCHLSPHKIKEFDGLVFDDVATSVLEKGYYGFSPNGPGRSMIYDIKDGRSFNPPLYPLFLVWIYKVFGHNFAAVRWFQVIIGTLTVLVVYIMGVRLFNKTCALLSALTVAVYPPFIQFTGLILRETLFVFLVAMIAYQLINLFWKPKSSYLACIILGVTIGLTALLKSVILFFLPVFLFGLLAGYSGKAREKFKTFALVVSTTLLVIFPWTVRNFTVHKKFVFISTEGGASFLIANNPDATGTNIAADGKVLWPRFSDEQKKAVDKMDEVSLDRAYFKYGLKYVAKEPFRYMRLAIRKFFIFWFDSYGSFKTIYGSTTRCFDAFLLLAGLFGIFISIRDWRRFIPLYLLILSFTLVHMILFVVVRNRFPIIPILSLFASYGFVSLKAEKRKTSAFLFTAIVALGYLYYHILRLMGKFKF